MAQSAHDRSLTPGRGREAKEEEEEEEPEEDSCHGSSRGAAEPEDHKVQLVIYKMFNQLMLRSHIVSSWLKAHTSVRVFLFIETSLMCSARVFPFWQCTLRV